MARKPRPRKLRVRAEPLPERPQAPKPDANAGDGLSDFLRTALDRAEHAHQKERDNIAWGYEDLEFLAGDQWPAWAKQARESQERPITVTNCVPQFVNQVTGEIETQRPSLKVIPIDARGKSEVGQLIAGMIRYIENRSEAQAAYMHGADQQVGAGIGHWQVEIEYADQTTYNKELRIGHIEDGIAVLWDPDSILPDRSDAMWCFVPVDLSREKFKKEYPEVPIEGFMEFERRYQEYWLHDDMIRVAVYWERRPCKRKLAIFPDGSIDDVTDAEPRDVAACKQRGAEIVTRDGHDVYRSLITIGHELEPAEKWPGRYIPIVPALGREIHIGKRRVRHGVIRHLKDPQRLANYVRTAQAELVALAPKAPWVGTEKNFDANPEDWDQANTLNLPKLTYVPDPANSGAPPQRSIPAQPSPALSELSATSENDMRQVTGIYQPALGDRSNETSGVAIDARKQQSDVGSFRYVTNFSLAVRHTGRILVDLIPHVYDTERMVHTMDRAGEVELVWINKAQGEPTLTDDEAPQDDPKHAWEEADGDVEGAEGGGDDQADASGLDMAEDAADENKNVGPKSPLHGVKLNDVTLGAYGIAVDTGTRYADAKEEAKAGMADFLKAFPPAAPLIADIFVKAQEWPLADEIAERLQIMLPPPIKALIEAGRHKGVGEIGPNGQPMPQGQQFDPTAPPPPQPPSPEMVKAQSDAQMAQVALQSKQIDLQIKQLDFQMKQMELQATIAGSQVKPEHIQALADELHKQRGMIHQLAASTAHVVQPEPTEGAPANGV